jgi:hypothetical protein
VTNFDEALLLSDGGVPVLRAVEQLPGDADRLSGQQKQRGGNRRNFTATHRDMAAARDGS